MNKIRVRRARPEELIDVADIVLDNFVSEIHGNIKELEGSNITNKDKFYHFYIERALSKTPFVVYIAELNNEMIGVIGQILCGDVKIFGLLRRNIEVVKQG